jgi:mono/diheme cytochrome c family protein
MLPILTGMLVLATTLMAQAAPPAQDPVNGEKTFNTMCTGCHTIGGGKLVGPDLQGVTDRVDQAWIKTFITAPDKVIASGDPTAVALVAQYGMQMPNLGLSPQQVDDLVAFLATKGSGAAPTQAAPTKAAAAAPTAGSGSGAAPAPTQAVAPAAPPAAAGPAANTALVLALNGNADYGQKIYSGGVSLQGGGKNCIACHSVEGVVPLGGGALGPDLTHVFTRYGGRQGLAATLGALPFPTMQGIFATRPLTVSEQADLLAFFQRADKLGQPQTQLYLLIVLAIGTVLAVLFFIGMIFFWPRQRMGIAQRLRKYGKL